MGKPKRYICKNCEEDCKSPGGLHKHYEKNPSHKPNYLEKRKKKVMGIPEAYLGKTTAKIVKVAKKKPTQGETNQALDKFLDHPSAALELIDAKILQQNQAITEASEAAERARSIANSTIEEAKMKIAKLEKLREFLKPVEVGKNPGVQYPTFGTAEHLVGSR